MFTKKKREEFKALLTERLDDLLSDANRTVSGMTDPAENFPDPTDRATMESDRNFELRIRDRERKLIGKIKEAIERTRPEGERHFTGEWILYNILEMKFMEGRKVRDIALRLAMSEADLYRKQKVAIENVAKIIMEMEEQAKDTGVTDLISQVEK